MDDLASEFRRKLDFEEGMQEDDPMGEPKSGAGRKRVYCPVVGCPKGDHSKAAGWASFKGLRDHVEEHAADRFKGTIPQAWLRDNRLGQCEACSKLLSLRF